MGSPLTCFESVNAERTSQLERLTGNVTSLRPVADSPEASNEVHQLRRQVESLKAALRLSLDHDQARDKAGETRRQQILRLMDGQ